MHRRWLSLPLFTTAVSGFYPYHDGHSGNNDKRFIPYHPSGQSQDDLVTVNVKKVYHKRDNKFNVVTSNAPSAENAIAINQDGADFSYISTIKFGSKEEVMYMLIDTGSAHTWVMGQNCTSKACTIHTLFGPEDSTTLNLTTKPWALSYGTGTVSGVLAVDTVKFANFSVNVGFGLATVTSDDFNNYPMDGILGLGQGPSTELGTPTFMESLKTQGKLTQSVVGIHLNRGSDNTKDGEIVFGGVNTAKFTGQISYTKTSTPDTWQIPVEDVFVNNVACNFSAKSAIIDTGTSYILIPPADAKQLHSLIPGSVNTGELFTIPCDSKASIEISFSGVKYSVSPKDYVGGTTSNNVCRSNIVGHQAFGPNEWILGDVFLKNVYSVFDFEQGRLGFATLGSGGSAAGVVTSSSISSAGSSTMASSTVKPSGTASATISAATSSSTSASVGNPFDANSSSSKNNGARSINQSYGMVLVMTVAFIIGLIV